MCFLTTLMLHSLAFLFRAGNRNSALIKVICLIVPCVLRKACLAMLQGSCDYCLSWTCDTKSDNVIIPETVQHLVNNEDIACAEDIESSTLIWKSMHEDLPLPLPLCKQIIPLFSSK